MSGVQARSTHTESVSHAVSVAKALGVPGEQDIEVDKPRFGIASQPADFETMTTISSREMNQDLARAKRAAVKGPVLITDRGKPAFVLTTFEEYERTHSQRTRLTASEALAMDTDEDIELELPERVPHIPTVTFD